jgi:hypothetical protein
VDSVFSARRFAGIDAAHARLLSVVIAAATALSVAGVAMAQEDEAARELLHETSGTFDIRLQVEPAEVLAGVVHFVVAVLAAGDSTPVEGAVVNIVATDPEGSAVQSRAVSTPINPGVYEANLVLEPGGLWTISLDVTVAGVGSASHEVSLSVAELDLSAGLAGTALWLLTTVALVVGGMYLWRRSRAALSRR